MRLCLSFGVGLPLPALPLRGQPRESDIAVGMSELHSLASARGTARRQSGQGGLSEIAALLQPERHQPPAQQPTTARQRKGSAGAAPAHPFTGYSHASLVPHPHPHASAASADLVLDYGRRTPEPPRGSYRLQPGDIVAAHPPSAPPAQREKGRHSKMTAAHLLQSVPYPLHGMMLAAGGGAGDPPHQLPYSAQGHRPPQHPSHQLAYPPSGGAAAVSASHRGGSIQSTIASARSTTYGKLSLQQPPPARLSNSPSPNSTPVKSSTARFHHLRDRAPGASSNPTPDGSSPTSPMASPRKTTTTNVRDSHQGPAEMQRKRALVNAPVPLALSWPSEHPSSGGMPPPGPPGRAFPSRGSVRASHPSALPNPHHGPPMPLAPHSGLGPNNFPAIRRGAQLIEALPVTLSPGSSFLQPRRHHQGEFDEEDYEDVALLDLAEDDALASTRLFAGTKKQRVGSGQRTSGPAATVVGRRREGGAGANSTSGSSAHGVVGHAGMIKKLDLSAAQSFRSPYTRRSFAPPAAAAAAGGSGAPITSRRTDVPPASEWGQEDSEPEEEVNHPHHHHHHHQQAGHHGERKQSEDESIGGGNHDDDNSPGGWSLDIGVAEDANPRFRASMEDAILVRRQFGPTYEVAAENKQQPPPSSSPSGSPSSDENKESSSHLPASSSSSESRGSFFAIYDGHGGRACVDFIARHFHREFARRLAALTTSTTNEVTKAMESAMARVDAAMALGPHGRNDEYQECGSTACVAYLRPCGERNRGRELFLANIGDAQAVLGVDKREEKRSHKRGSKEKRKSGAATQRSASPTPSGIGGGLLGNAHQPPSTDRTPKKSRNGSTRDSAAAVPAASTSGLFAKTLVAKGSSKASQQQAPAEQASLPKKLSAMSLSYPHVATDPKEMTRIKSAGGCVFANRVNGCLAVSRAFGDHALKAAGVSCMPYQQHVQLTSAHRLLVLGCDGLFDVLSHQEAVNVAHSALVAGKKAQGAATALVQEALKKGTTDNVSVQVIVFNRPRSNSHE